MLARRTLVALTIGCIVALAALTATGAGSRIATDALGALLAVVFIALALIDFRASLAVAIFELVLGGAGGHWIDFGSLSGRIFLISVVTLRAVWLTFVDWRRGLHPLLGRYGAHALALAIVIPALWIPLGLVDGNGSHNAVADGDAFFFFAFVLVIVTVVRRGEDAWLKRVFFAACATNAAAYFGLIVLSTSGVVSLDRLREWLSVRLVMGGVIGYMNGHFRLFTAGSLFLVVGLVLVTQRLLARPRDRLLWLLGAILTVDLIVTYTRGLWLAALVSVALVIALEVRSARQLGYAVGIPGAAVVLAVAIGSLVGASPYGYVSARAASIVKVSGTRYRTHLADPGFESSLNAWRVSGARSRRVPRSGPVARVGRHSLELSSSAAGKDAYVFQDLAVRPDTQYSVSAWVNAHGLRRPAAGGRGLLVWDPQDGLMYTVPLTDKTNGWKRLGFSFQTQAYAHDIQLRLYAPKGHVLWDTVQLAAHGPARAVEADAPTAAVIPPTRPSSPKTVLDPGFESSLRAWGVTRGLRRRRVSRTGPVARLGRHSLELSSSGAGKDAYVFQNLAGKPNTEYSVSAWVNARKLAQPAAGGRGLLVWDPQDGLVYTVPLTSKTDGWRRLSFRFRTRAYAEDIQLRLYAPKGHVLWDNVRFAAHGAARAARGNAPAVQGKAPIVADIPPIRPSLPKAVLDPGFESSSWAWGISDVPSLRVLQTGSVARAGKHSLELSNSAAGEDAYVFQDLAVRPNMEYSVSAWVNARGLRRPAAGGRGLLVWDAQDGLTHTVPLTGKTNGWRRLSFSFQTREQAHDIQLRLYAPEGRVFWDAVRLASHAPVLVSATAGSNATQTMALASSSGGGADSAGEASNAYRVTEAKALWGYIERRPIYGYGFGKVASRFGTGYSYELSYLDLLLKAGFIGLLLYLSFPVRLVVDALRLRRRPAPAIPGGAEGIRSAGVVVGVVTAILIAGATNPYLFAAFGLVPILVMLAWLEGSAGSKKPT